MKIGDVDYIIADRREHLDQSCRLVYENYIRMGYCRIDPVAMRIYLFDALPETRVFVGMREGRVVVTATLVLDSPVGLPSQGVFGDRLAALRASGEKLCEVSKFASSRALGRKGIDVLAQLFRYIWLYARRIAGADRMLVMVEPHHVPFYERYNLFRRIADERPDAHAGGTPSILLGHPLVEEEVERLARENAGDERGRRRYDFYFRDPDIPRIIEDQLDVEERIVRIEDGLRAAQGGRGTFALKREEQDYLRFKLFILEYNLDRMGRECQETARRGYYAEAGREYRQLLQTVPEGVFRRERARVYVALARMDFFLANYEEGEACAREAVRLTSDPVTRADACRFIGLFRHMCGDRAAEREAFGKALELARRSKSAIILVAVLQAMARCLQDASAFEEARPLLEEAERVLVMETGPVAGRLRHLILHDLTNVEKAAGRFEMADAVLARYARACVEGPFDAMERGLYYNLLGDMFAMRKDYRKSREHYEEGLKAFPARSNPLNFAVSALGCVRARIALGDLPEAREILAAIDAVDPVSFTPLVKEERRVAAGLLALAEGRWEEARREVASVLPGNPTTGRYDHAALDITARALLLDGRPDEAVALLARIEPDRHSPQVMGVVVLREICRCLAGDPEGARRGAEDLLPLMTALPERYIASARVGAEGLAAWLAGDVARAEAALDCFFAGRDAAEDRLGIAQIVFNDLRIGRIAARGMAFPAVGRALQRRVNLLDEISGGADVPLLGHLAAEARGLVS
ncbi:MAG: hypothetical protein V1809_16595 [Planctomycetota bacterium]